MGFRRAIAVTFAGCALGTRVTAARSEASRGSYASRAEIPSGCELEQKLADDSRCLFDDQCQSGFCCPYYRNCQGNVIGQWHTDPLMQEILVAPPGGEGTNGCVDGWCRACNFEEDANAGSPDVNPCLTFSTNSNGSNAQPVLTSSSQSFQNMVGVWDLSNAACKCDSRFLSYMESDCWVPECNGGSQANQKEEYANTGTVTCPSGNCGANLWNPPWAATPDEACAAWSTNDQWGALQGGSTLANACQTSEWYATNCAATCCPHMASAALMQKRSALRSS
jgi:hypothetical protein